MEEFLDRLNPQQREAAECIEGPLLVLAGAGTGKTSVITARIAHMIHAGIAPENILGVTFTNKAAREMRERLDRLVPEVLAHKVTLGTFHSICARVLRRFIQLAGNYTASYSIADDSDQKSILRQAAAELGYSKDEIPTDFAAACIGRWKNRILNPDDALADAQINHPGEVDCAHIYKRYQELLELQNVVDFDDMLLLTIRIFETSPETLEYYRNLWQYLLVDEYQDTNAAQFRIIELLAGDRHNLCAVGDDDQSIYAWRGADVSNILDFPKIFPGTKQIKLEQNYRSTNHILDAANAVIAVNTGRYSKNLWSAKGSGESIKIVRTANGEAEAAFVVNTILNITGRGERPFSDFAILYRSNHLSRVFEQEFRRMGIRPRVVGGQEFFQRKEVKDAASYLKLLLNSRDDQSLLRVIGVPPRGIGDKAILRMRELKKSVPNMPLCDIMREDHFLGECTKSAASSIRNFSSVLAHYREEFKQTHDLALTVKQYLEEVGYLNGLQRIYKDYDEATHRLENVTEFLSYIGSFEQKFSEAHPGEHATLQDFMENYSLMDDNDRTEDDADRDAPVLSTVHASKGLEYPFVFIVGMEQNLFPHERALQENALEEERRLFYVAITRAREELIISYAGERFRFREFTRTAPSQFLRDIPEEISERNVPDDFCQEASMDRKIQAFSDILKMFDED